MFSVIGLAFVTCATPYVGVALLIIGLASTGTGYGAGFMVNYNDIGGSFAGLTFGMSNTVGTIPGFIAPMIVGLITTHVSSIIILKYICLHGVIRILEFNLFNTVKFCSSERNFTQKNFKVILLFEL